MISSLFFDDSVRFYTIVGIPVYTIEPPCATTLVGEHLP